MAKVECFNCKRTTPVVSPKYRCIYCNYPMHKYTETKEKQPEEKIIKDFKQNDYSQDIVDKIKPNPISEPKIEEKEPEPVKQEFQAIADQNKSKREEAMRSLEKRLAEIQAKNTGKPNEVPSFLDNTEPKETVNDALDVKPVKTISELLAENVKEKENKLEVNDLFDTGNDNPVVEAEPPSIPIVEPPSIPVVEPPTFVEATPIPEPPKPKTEEILFRKNSNPEKSGKIVAGWLVVHTENRLPVTYELFEGHNIIGRPDGPHHVDIKIEDDKYVSRTHCTIEIKKDFIHRFIYILRDGTSKQKRSTNGTYINGLDDKLLTNSVVYLKDEDTVQVGETKLAFKDINSVINQEEAASSVINTDYTKTVVLNFKPK